MRQVTERVEVTRSNGRQGVENAAGIEVRDVWAGYGERQVIRGLNLSVERGSVTALAGPNGVGKSTLLRLLAGSLKPSRGTTRVAGVDVASLSARERARLVAVVPQNVELPPGTAALEVVLMGRNPHMSLLSWESEADVGIAVESMRMTDTDDLLDRRVDELSGGERQRVAIATALAQQTQVLLLDEPTANLDLAYQPAIMTLMRELASAGKTVVVAVHDLTLAGQFCDEVALMGGTMHAVGSPEEVLTEVNIRKAYGADVTVLAHPSTGKPIVVNP